MGKQTRNELLIVKYEMFTRNGFTLPLFQRSGMAKLGLWHH